tara:strand:+ start:19 stop:777 length:759 start_codon:yes stop_codon:yes gene_type:complete
MTNKLKYFIANWKMFGDLTSFKIISMVSKFNNKYNKINKYKIIFCVPNTLIHTFSNKLKLNSISIGAQNSAHHQHAGPYTGLVNPSMLKAVGAKFVILGHSENRSQGETNELIKKKLIESSKKNLEVILCIGESFSEKKQKKTYHVIKNQLRKILNKKMNSNNIILAYEPIWSIGTNNLPKENELRKIIKLIKIECKNILKSKKFPKVLYGGSVNPKNVHLFSKITELDGLLIGGASQSSKKFIDIIKNYYK